jgi:hypothetical protein
MQNKRNRGWLYIAIAVVFGALVESHQSHPISVASFLGASGMVLLILAIVGELGFWIWRKISD